jgi:hypothetical protein
MITVAIRSPTPAERAGSACHALGTPGSPPNHLTAVLTATSRRAGSLGVAVALALAVLAIWRDKALPTWPRRRVSGSAERRRLSLVGNAARSPSSSSPRASAQWSPSWRRADLAPHVGVRLQLTGIIGVVLAGITLGIHPGRCRPLASAGSPALPLPRRAGLHPCSWRSGLRLKEDPRQSRLVEWISRSRRPSSCRRIGTICRR